MHSNRILCNCFLHEVSLKNAVDSSNKIGVYLAREQTK